MGAQLRESSDLGSRSTFREPLLGIKILARNSRRLPHWSAMQLQAPPVIHLLIRARHPTAFCCSAKGIGGWLHSAPRLATKWWNEHHHWFYTTCFNLPPLHSTQLWICVHPRWVTLRKFICTNNNSPLNLHCIEDWDWYTCRTAQSGCDKEVQWE